MLNRNIYEFYEKIEISKGSKANIKKGDLVIAQNGVIGVIEKVKENSSEVLLLTNSKINLSVKINNAYGILTSKDHQILVKNIKLTEEIKEGNTVTTSGLTDIPGGILIGKVKQVKKDKLELEYILEIDVNVNFKEIKFVGVVTS